MDLFFCFADYLADINAVFTLHKIRVGCRDRNFDRGMVFEEMFILLHLI